MRASLLLVAVASFSLTYFSFQSAAQTAPSETAAVQQQAIQQQIEADEQAIGRAIHTRDFAALEKFWSPRMVVNSPDNSVLTRDEVIAAIKRGGLNYSSLKGTTESFHVFGDVAVEMGHEDFVMAAGPAAGKPLKRRFTDVWQRTADGWVQIARQATILEASADWVYGHSAAPPQSQ